MPLDPTDANPFLRRVLDTYNSGRPDDFDALLTEDCVLERDGREARGRVQVKQVISQLYRAVPDLEYRIDDAISSGGKVAIRWEGHGRHRGDYAGIAATGGSLSYGGITFFELRGDLISRIWVSTNLIEQLRDLALATAPRPAPPEPTAPEAIH
jgi:steroid delta-isomerase-like uncharacterized protein